MARKGSRWKPEVGLKWFHLQSPKSEGVFSLSFSFVNRRSWMSSIFPLQLSSSQAAVSRAVCGDQLLNFALKIPVFIFLKVKIKLGHNWWKFFSKWEWLSPWIKSEVNGRIRKFRPVSTSEFLCLLRFKWCYLAKFFRDTRAAYCV